VNIAHTEYKRGRANKSVLGDLIDGDSTDERLRVPGWMAAIVLSSTLSGAGRDGAKHNESVGVER